jgi:hypothetical protein
MDSRSDRAGHAPFVRILWAWICAEYLWREEQDLRARGLIRPGEELHFQLPKYRRPPICVLRFCRNDPQCKRCPVGRRRGVR